MCGNCSDSSLRFSSGTDEPEPSEVPVLVEEPRPVDLIDRNWNRGKW